MVYMEIKLVIKEDISKWKNLSLEHDKYVKELVSDLTEWYEGNENSISFDKYMESKINQKEAFIAVDNKNNCLGIIAFSYKRNYITFFGITEDMDIEIIGNKLLHYVFELMDKNKPISINAINSKSEWIMKYIEVYIKNGFVFNGNTLENGVPVNIYAKL